jgi:hypothetical protein
LDDCHIRYDLEFKITKIVKGKGLFQLVAKELDPTNFSKEG